MTKNIAIFLLPGFALTSFSLTVEAFSVANLLTQNTLYKYTVYSVTDDPNEKVVTSSNGMKVQTDKHISEFEQADLICLCAYQGAPRFQNDQFNQILKRHYIQGGYLASLSSGSFIFANAGLLKNTTCTVTSEHEDVFRELYPHITLQESLYTVGNRIYTCRGGMTALDMMMYIIGKDFGTELTERISVRFDNDKIRTLDEINKSNQHLRLRLRSPALGAAVEIMEANIEEPYSIEVISDMIGSSVRQLELLFRKHFATTPNKYYLKIRLQRVFKLVEDTRLPLSEIANACGFSSHSYMGQCFRKEFGDHPSAIRKRSYATH
ncbi:HTH-type transcriptional regulator CdhR [Marinomonas aquimarina]|uniref:HTH-type transcriptional regulator CdhR n=1 Tax=Marinomonas aquimarina TaxID=295068 RepID=A0A1A8TFM6_9GAMM|nr:GlxA family transcriptional regulator [Marinomonas aquimarina]SBS32172.1 HTH-type transcriptional regulator CdhR [Marinomonas aquimarina]